MRASKFRECYRLGALLLHGSLSRLHQVLSLEHAHVPRGLEEEETFLRAHGSKVTAGVQASYHVVQRLWDTVVSGVQQVDLDALHGDRAPSSDFSSHVHGSGHHGLLVCKHTAGEQSTGHVGRTSTVIFYLQPVFEIGKVQQKRKLEFQPKLRPDIGQ